MSVAARSSARKILRLLAYVRPYWVLLVIALLASLAYGTGITARSYLLKPLMDDVVLPSFEADSIEEAVKKARSEARDVEALDAQREALRQTVAGSLGNLVLAGLIIMLALPALRLIRDLANEWVMTRLFVDLEERVGGRLLDLPLSIHRTRGGATSSRARPTTPPWRTTLKP